MLRNFAARVHADRVQRAQVEPLTLAHMAEFLAAVRRSRRLHGRWVSPPRDEYTFRNYLSSKQPPHAAAYCVLAQDGQLAGVINLNEIVRGVFQSAFLGYYAFAPHAHCGLMSAGLARICELAFRRHRLHRLEANIQPGNAPSIALVRRAGFRLEGFSPRYLKIAGRWRDHERWALTLEDWQAMQRAARNAC